MTLPIEAAALVLVAALLHASWNAMVKVGHDRLVVLTDGRIVEQGTTARVLDLPDHPYTRALLDAVPSADPTRRRRRAARQR